jgi:murein DD-endopeptidase MepM/ murein hydrolase activator NlpD
MFKNSISSLLILGLLLSGCASAFTTPTPTVTPSPIPPTATAIPTATATLTPTLTPSPTATPDPSAGFNMSSPLQDIQLAELKEIISGTFQNTSPGMDDGHHGVDFSYYSYGTHSKMEGIEIYSMMPGKVVGVILKRNPYGNAVIIETPLVNIPPAFVEKLSVPTELTPYPYNPRLIGCEALKNQSWSIKPASIYLLYGHMKETPLVTVGQQVQSGERIGLVGNTGASGNAHLHLEMRWGPGGTVFASMSHYDGGATDQERLEYCTWRISGKYVMMDPMNVINAWLSQ